MFILKTYCTFWQLDQPIFYYYIWNVFWIMKWRQHPHSQTRISRELFVVSCPKEAGLATYHCLIEGLPLAIRDLELREDLITTSFLGHWTVSFVQWRQKSAKNQEEIRINKGTWERVKRKREAEKQSEAETQREVATEIEKTCNHHFLLFILFIDWLVAIFPQLFC